MTTVVADAPSDVRPWAAYLDWYAERERLEGERKATFIESQLRAIEAWRDVDWKDIQHRLKRDHGYVVPPDREPYWASPAAAVLFKEQHVTQNLYDKASGTAKRASVSTGWEPVGPLPLANPSQVVYYLEKGLRLRPPRENEELGVELSKAAPPSEGLQEPVEKPKYSCVRHGRNEYHFRGWEQYIAHCDKFTEPIDYPVPEEVVERAKSFLYFCVVHDTGFSNFDLAESHVKNERRRSSSKTHLPIEKMATQQVKKKR